METNNQTVYRCPLCKKKKNIIIHAETRAKYQVNQCLNCKLVFRVPIPSKEKITTFYQKGYVDYLLSGIGTSGLRLKPNIKDSILEKKTFLKRINFDKIILKLPNKSLFEVGCGTGDLLKICAEKGFTINGCDLSLECINYIKDNYSYPIIHGYFEDIKMPNNSYSLIALWSVLEHAADPVYFMKKVHARLKPNGLIIISAPNIKSYNHIISGPLWRGFTRGHIIFFSKNTLEATLKITGFKNIKIYFLKPSFQEIFSLKTLKLEFSKFGIKNTQLIKCVLLLGFLISNRIFRCLLYKLDIIQSHKMYATATK